MKGDISLNVIVGIAIALIVLVTVIFIFQSQASRGSDNLASCGLNGGECLSNCKKSEDRISATCYGPDGKASSQVCCRKNIFT